METNKALISAVYKQIPVWDKRNKAHSNRNVIENCWKKIAEEMKFKDVSSLKRKWKYLRDQFSVELGKIKPRSGNAADSFHKSKWPYFHQLLFLKDVVKPRTLKGNCSDLQPPDENGSESDNRKDMDFELPTTSNAALKRKDSFDIAMINFEKKKLELLKAKKEKSKHDDDDDEDMQFFKSLLPHVRRIPPNLKLTFRNRIQDIVNSFAYSQAPSLPQSSPPPSFLSSTSSIPESPTPQL